MKKVLKAVGLAIIVTAWAWITFTDKNKSAIQASRKWLLDTIEQINMQYVFDTVKDWDEARTRQYLQTRNVIKLPQDIDWAKWLPCAPVPTDTVYEYVVGKEPKCTFGICGGGISGFSIISFGCPIQETIAETVYFEPSGEHSEILQTEFKELYP